MKLIIQPKIFETFSNLTLGVINASNINNQGESEKINQLLRSAEKNLSLEFTNFEAPSKHPNILCWRQAYKKFGSDPHDYRSSVESLARRALKGNQIPHINKLVDLYNYFSLKYLLTVGGEDIDAINGNVILDFAKGNESFVKLGGTENEPPEVGEVVYKDEVGVICRRWNWREAERTKLTEKTTSAILVIEGLAPVTKETVVLASQELADLIKQYCGGEIELEIFDNK